jgi:hypothetical protein
MREYRFRENGEFAAPAEGAHCSGCDARQNPALALEA